MRTPTLLGAIALFSLPVACGAGAPDPVEGAIGSGHAVVSPSSSASGSAPSASASAVVVDASPAAPTAPEEKRVALFAEVAMVGGYELSTLEGSLGALTRESIPESNSYDAFGYELDSGTWKLVGSRTFGTMDYTEGLSGKPGGRIAITALVPYGRGADRVEFPLRGGKPVHRGDPQMLGMTEWAANRTPQCGERPGENLLSPMKSDDDYQSFDRTLALIGLDCGGKRVVQVREGTTTSVHPVGDTDRLTTGNRGVYLVGERLSRWDGKGFALVGPRPPPALFDKGAPQFAVLEVPGAPLFASRPDVTYALSGGEWTRVTAEDGQGALTLLWDGKTVWATATRKQEGTVLYQLHLPGTPTPPKQDTTALKDDPRPEPTLAPMVMTAPGPKCQKHVVVLYGFTKVTPADYDFPLTRKAVKGHTELGGVEFAVTLDRGQKYFVGITPSFDKAFALKGVIEKGVSGSKPQVVCADPQVIRKLGLDLTSGEVVE